MARPQLHLEGGRKVLVLGANSFSGQDFVDEPVQLLRGHPFPDVLLNHVLERVIVVLGEGESYCCEW